MEERRRIESLGGRIDIDGYLNGQLGVTRALGDWHLKGMKEIGERTGPLSAEPELKMITLTNEDEFLIDLLIYFFFINFAPTLFSNLNSRSRTSGSSDVKRTEPIAFFSQIRWLVCSVGFYTKP